MGGDKAPTIPPGQPAGSGSNDSAPKPTPQHVSPHHQNRDSVLVGRSAAAAESGATAGVSGGAPSGETGVSANVDLGFDADPDKTRFTVTSGSSNHPIEVTVGSDNAADAVSNSGHGNGNGNGNQGVEVPVDLDVDLGVDDGPTTPAMDTTDTDKPGHGPPADVVELLDGLVRRRGKK
jgi:hypothetical protein